MRTFSFFGVSCVMFCALSLAASAGHGQLPSQAGSKSVGEPCGARLPAPSCEEFRNQDLFVGGRSSIKQSGDRSPRSEFRFRGPRNEKQPGSAGSDFLSSEHDVSLKEVPEFSFPPEKVQSEGDTLPSVPLPAGLPLILTGLAVLGIMSWRSRVA